MDAPTPTTTPVSAETPNAKKPVNWHKVGAIAGIIAVVVAIIVPAYFYWVQRNDKTLSYGIISQGPVVSVKDDLNGRLKILLDGKPIGSVNLIVLRLENTGNVAIRKSDYDKPISISFGPGSQVLGGEIIASRPLNLGETLKVSPRGIALDPVLLNKGDGFVIKALVNSQAPSVALDGRIADVAEIRKVDVAAPQQGHGSWVDWVPMMSILLDTLAAIYVARVFILAFRQKRQIDANDIKIADIEAKINALK